MGNIDSHVFHVYTTQSHDLVLGIYRELCVKEVNIELVGVLDSTFIYRYYFFGQYTVSKDDMMVSWVSCHLMLIQRAGSF